MSKEKSNDKDKDVKRKLKNKYILNDSLKEKLLEWPEVLAFIEVLQKHIEKLTKKLDKMKAKKDCKNVSTQTGNESTDKTKSFVEDIQEAAEMVTKNSGFVYEETSGMYYDYNTGYYYNAEFGLYYDGNLGNYLKYNQDTHSYEFHSHVGPPTTSNDTTKKKRALHSDRKRHKRRRSSTESKDVEEGECSSSSSTDSEKEIEDTRHYPPCMRIIIESSSVTNLKTGSLHIITCSGGSIGREGEHSILISDINISKYHLQINYNNETCKYYCIDMGSRNGTLLNGKRMSPSKQESEPMEILHGSRLQIGSTILICHIHNGNQTCGHCEPGLIQTKAEIESTTTSTKEIHKTELKNLKKKFGINSYEEDNTKLASGYTDRAEQRRQVIGSQNPHEKTQTASVDESIKSDNKGFKMLQKLGWKEGDSLGKEGKGLLEPIKIEPNEIVENTRMHLNDGKRRNIWMKTQDRYQKLTPSIILDDDENC